MVTRWCTGRLAGGEAGRGSRRQQSSAGTGPRQPDPGSALLLLTAVVLAPLFEEVISPRTLLPVLAARVGSGTAVLLSALVFALAHLSIGELAPLTVLGIGLGLLRLRGGRLLPCVLMHALWNGITFLNLLLL